MRDTENRMNINLWRDPVRSSFDWAHGFQRIQECPWETQTTDKFCLFLQSTCHSPVNNFTGGVKATQLIQEGASDVFGWQVKGARRASY